MASEASTENEGSLRIGRSATGAEIGELQRKISLAEEELRQLKQDLDQTKKQAKQAELSAQDNGRTNRKLKTEIQTLTDMSNRKDRQAENSKATAFFFEGQVKKYMDEIETARQGMGHLKELDDQLNQAKAEQAELEKSSKEETARVNSTIKSMKEAHEAKKEALKADIDKAYADLEKVSAQALQLQQEIQQKMESELPGLDIHKLEREYRNSEQKQKDEVEQVHDEVKQLLRRLEQSEASTLSHEESMVVVKEEMDRIMRRLRAMDQLSASTSNTPTTSK
ncbi:hypothetical protein [Parasitella parasitica]|uniref:Uncharacterized protein n=1 Tax=Parasitella parasitica TaxID=35722 RepID=A0A0B7MTT0_9FUNG|nr:hypothetical protein [Parasitella parasitica]